MTAASPYAPPSRNSHLRRSSSSQVGSNRGRGTAMVALFFFVSKFWQDIARRGKLGSDVLRRSPILRWLVESFTGQQVARNLPVAGNDTGANETNSSGSDSYCAFHSNLSTIREVLTFWFGSYSPEEAQKKLWMISNSSSKLRDMVDSDISSRFQHLLCELAHQDSKLWEEWCLDDADVFGVNGKVAAIIVLDQFSRHILRLSESRPLSEDFRDLPTKSEVDEKALKTAQLFLDKHQNEIRCGMIPTPYCIFALMPFRHASTLDTLSLVQEYVNMQDHMSVQMAALVGRFRKATNRRMAALQDEARRTGSSKGGSAASGDQTTEAHRDEEILECFPFEADPNTAAKHQVSKTILRFLESINVKAGEGSPKQAIITSLSGGVDSMVIASVAANLKKIHKLNVELIAVHIDYGNRPESAAEADYVRRYCETIDTHYILRRIDEVRRGVTARDEYERIARDMRYGTYREAIAFARNDRHCANEQDIGIMLGHHKGDLRENVLSNAHKGCGPLDLSGMTSISKNNGVTILRPLLTLEKSAIYDYAHLFGVPYFKDTTPEWSTRGKLRNKLLPLIQDVYGDGSLRNLSNLAIESDDCRALLFESVLGPCLSRVKKYPMGLVLETSEWKQETIFFWKFVLREALHSGGLGMFSDKSVQAFLARIQADDLREGWLQCRRDYAVYLQHDGKVFVFYPSSFPFLKDEMYDIAEEPLSYGESRQIGPWLVQGDPATSDDSGSSGSVSKAIPSMTGFMEGFIRYSISVPTTLGKNGDVVPRPLVFRKFTKATRPTAWKNNEQNRNFYLKVQETLPLLGNDDIAIGALKQPNTTIEVQVTLQLATACKSDESST